MTTDVLLNSKHSKQQLYFQILSPVAQNFALSLAIFSFPSRLAEGVEELFF